jgi:hypothetical protein
MMGKGHRTEEEEEEEEEKKRGLYTISVGRGRSEYLQRYRI